MFLIDQGVKIILLKVFGTTRPKLFRFTNEDAYDPYFEVQETGNGKAKMKPRTPPPKTPSDLIPLIESIRSTCYWMDESVFGMRASKLLNNVFGTKTVKVIEEEYVAENLVNKGTLKVSPKPETGDDAGEVVHKSRRIGVGFAPFMQIVPVIGNYVVFAINLWIFYCMLTVGLGYKVGVEGKKLKIRKVHDGFLGLNQVGKMLVNIIVDLGIGFIPFVGAFISIIHRSSSRNLAIFYKALDKQYEK